MGEPGSHPPVRHGDPISLAPPEPALFAATTPGASPGGFYGPGRLVGLRGPAAPAAIGAHARHRDDATRLWTAAEELTDVSFRS